MQDKADQTKPVETSKGRFKFSTGGYLLVCYQLISGMGSYCYILSMPIYMASILKFSDTTSTTIFHARSGIGTITNICGAILGDSFLGRSKTYLLFQPFSILLIGSISVMAIYTKTEGIITTYFLLAILGGLVSPAIRTIIADQIPKDNKIMLSTFLHCIYFMNNFGVIIVAYLAPIMHKDIYCFDNECYPLVFFISFLLSSLAFMIFVVGFLMKLFVIYKPTENLLLNILKCIHHAVKKRILLGKSPPTKTWLDYSNEKYDKSFINDIKIAKSLLIFLIAHPLFWTVFEQISSIWTLQAQYMDGMISEQFVIKADQMQTLNPILVVLIIPLFELVVYPCLDKINFKVPYRIVTGQFFTVLACVSMIFIQFQIDSVIEPKNSDTILSTLFNGAKTNLTVKYDSKSLEITSFQTKSFRLKQNSYFVVNFYNHKVNILTNSSSNKDFLTVFYENLTDFQYVSKEVTKQTNGGYANVRMFNLVESKDPISILLKARVGINKEFSLFSRGYEFGNYVKCGIGLFDVFLVNKNQNINKKIGKVTLFPAESKTLVISGKATNETFVDLSELRLKLPNILWQIIPYILVTLGEIFFNVNTGIFLYGEAPLSMKAMLLAAEYICIALGNIFILALKQLLSNMSLIYLFLICGILVFASGILTGVLGYFYLKNRNITDCPVNENSDSTDL
uniref:Slc15a-2 n=1 Tax=Schmidtea mediterranea TaxID=79327 RepID=A0A0H3YK58_SCHMD|nr:slc15a-2 [Schmidtea mediterranea]